MRSLSLQPIWAGAAVLGLTGLCLAAAAITLGTGRIGSQADLAVAERHWDDVTGSIDTIGSGGFAGSARSLPLTDEQRGHIFDRIMKLSDVPVAKVPAPAATSSVPSTVPLQQLPASVTREIPVVQGYKFVKLDDRILLVSPLDRSVVAEMPRYRTLLD
jgi:Protein of unknown function (DUF1236)